MNIAAFNGSIRGAEGNTNLLVEEFLKGCEKEGARTERYFLKDYHIQYCKACFNCWTETPGQCILKDNMTELIKAFRDSHIAVLATPLYVDTISALMKKFLERLLPLVEPFFKEDESGESVHPRRYETSPRLVVIASSGFPEFSHFQVLELLFKRIARNFQTEISGEIYCGAGELMRFPVSSLKEKVENYKKLLQKAGKEVVRNGFIKAESQEEINEPLISAKMYRKMINQYWLTKIKKS